MVGISVEPLVVIEGLTPAAQVFSQTELIECHSESPININHILICRLRHPTCPLSWSSVRKRLRAFSITAQGVCHTPNLPLTRLNLLYLIIVLENKRFQLCNGSCRHSFETHRTVCAFVCTSTVVRNEWKMLFSIMFATIFGRYANFERRLQQNPYFWRK